MAQIMSPLLTLRRFETAAHAVLPRRVDTAAMVAAGAIAIGTQLIGSPSRSGFDAAFVPGLIAALAIAARVGREAAQRRRGEKSFSTSAIALSRFQYLGCAVLAVTATLLAFAVPAMTHLLELLGV
jgi:hypothetical protein